MADTRHKNAKWTLNINSNGTVPHGDAQLAVLMDIRDELQAIHSLVACHNVQLGFVAMQRLDKHLRKKWPLPKRKRGAKK